jgi:hypothetical protein
MRAVLLFFVVALCAGSAVAQTALDGIVVRTSLKPESGAVVGQQVRLLIDVLFADAMPRPPRVTMPEMPGAQIVRYESQATTMDDRIDGKDYAGQRFEFALYPRRGGALEVPAPVVTVLDAKGDTLGRVQGKAAKMDVSVPVGVDPSRPVIATSKLSLEEQWSPAQTTAFRGGDALVRTVTREAADVTGMAMLDLAFPAPSGVRVYLDPPQSEDRVDRGNVTGRRIDKATYVFETGGSFTLPGVAQPWWDLSTGRLRTARAPDVTVAVAAAPAAPVPATNRMEGWVFAAATIVGTLALAWWAAPRLQARQAERRARWLASEPKAFGDLQTACRQGEAPAIYRAFVLWRQRVSRPDALSPLAEEIEAALFAGASWSHDEALAFAGRVEAARLPGHRVARSRIVLAPLNPASLAVRTPLIPESHPTSVWRQSRLGSAGCG